VRHLAAWAVWFVVLWWLWILLAGEWNRYEWVAATAAAAIAAAVGELARARAGVGVRIPLRWLARSWLVLPTVVVDFAIVMWVLVRSLVRREVVRGVFRTRPVPAAGGDATAIGIRAWATVLSDYSPNAYVVDIDHRQGRVLLHDLVPYRKSEEPI
jgi:hypothetical protein